MQHNLALVENTIYLIVIRHQIQCGQTRPVFSGSTRFWAYFRVQTGRVGPQDPKTGPIRSGWPLKGFKFGFNPIMYLINPNEPDLNPILGRVGPPAKIQQTKIAVTKIQLSLLITKHIIQVGSKFITAASKQL